MQNKKLAAVLWDAENQATKNVQLVIDKITEAYHIVSAMAFADWSMPSLKEMSEDLDKQRFELIHTPHCSEKNAADKKLMEYGRRILYNNSTRIEVFVLVTADADFKPFVDEIRQNGKRVIICGNSANMSLSLLQSAEQFLNVRISNERVNAFSESNPVPKDYAEQIVQTKQFQVFFPPAEVSVFNKKVCVPPKGSLDEAFLWLKVAIKKRMSCKNKVWVGSSQVKQEIEKDHSLFNVKTYNFSKWGKFVEDAVKKGIVKS